LLATFGCSWPCLAGGGRGVYVISTLHTSLASGLGRQQWNGAGDWDGLLMAYRNNRFAALW